MSKTTWRGTGSRPEIGMMRRTTLRALGRTRLQRARRARTGRMRRLRRPRPSTSVGPLRRCGPTSAPTRMTLLRSLRPSRRRLGRRWSASGRTRLPLPLRWRRRRPRQRRAPGSRPSPGPPCRGRRQRCRRRCSRRRIGHRRRGRLRSSMCRPTSPRQSQHLLWLLTRCLRCSRRHRRPRSHHCPLRLWAARPDRRGRPARRPPPATVRAARCRAW
mmetsp:Transcript_14926/g.44631  ORF Transcript_14926/g.44631 Transcript_14926/m.44631 type:complete len:216 (+) Transcript_14926:765-1412(+)